MRTTVRRRLLAVLLAVAGVGLGPTAAAADAPEALADREQDTSSSFRTGPVTVAGTSYAKSLVFDLRGEDVGDSHARTYDLGGRCSSLSAVLGLSDTTEPEVRVRQQVFTDDALRHDVESVKGAATPLSLDVSGARQLRLVVTVVRNTGFAQQAAFADATVTCRGVTPSVVSATASASSVAAGGSTTLSGAVADAGGSPVAGSAVEVQAREHGERDFTTVATVRTDDAGRWTASVRPRYSTRYRALVPATARRAAVAAPEEPVVVVRSLLSLSAQRLGTRSYRFFGTLRPAQAGRTVSLYRRSAGREVLLSRTTVDGRGVYDVRRTFSGSGRFDLVVRASGDAFATAAASAVRPTSVY